MWLVKFHNDFSIRNIKISTIRKNYHSAHQERRNNNEERFRKILFHRGEFCDCLRRFLTNQRGDRWALVGRKCCQSVEIILLNVNELLVWFSKRTNNSLSSELPAGITGSCDWSFEEDKSQFSSNNGGIWLVNKKSSRRGKIQRSCQRDPRICLLGD